ncbi:unnamed protein product, partial [Closterium sp. NIES-53]
MADSGAPSDAEVPPRVAAAGASRPAEAAAGEEAERPAEGGEGSADDARTAAEVAAKKANCDGASSLSAEPDSLPSATPAAAAASAAPAAAPAAPGEPQEASAAAPLTAPSPAAPPTEPSPAAPPARPTVYKLRQAHSVLFTEASAYLLGEEGCVLVLQRGDLTKWFVDGRTDAIVSLLITSALLSNDHVGGFLKKPPVSPFSFSPVPHPTSHPPVFTAPSLRPFQVLQGQRLRGNADQCSKQTDGSTPSRIPSLISSSASPLSFPPPPPLSHFLLRLPSLISSSASPLPSLPSPSPLPFSPPPAIHRAAGPGLVRECKAVPEVSRGVRCPTGQAVCTGAAELPVKHVIHTVGPIYTSTQRSAPLLHSAYARSMEEARKAHVKFIAFPAVSCGIYGYPFPDAAQVSLEALQATCAGFSE